MKKTTTIVLTIVSGLSFKISTAQDLVQLPSIVQPDTNCVNMDSVYYCQTPPVEYSYYFRFNFFNSIYRYCFPRRYFYLTHPGFYCGPGFHHHQHHHHDHNQHFYYGAHRGVTGSNGHRLASANTSNGSPRGGFGHFGSTHSIAA
ncbi:MAG: hypothetical protein ACHQII_07250 [Bacteroidia bacterium]